MRATIAKKDLAEALGRLMPAVAVKPQTPITAGIYLKAEAHQLKLRATNFTLDISATIPANVEIEGAVVVGGKLLNMIVAKLGGEIVTLDELENKLAIKSDAAKFELPTFDASDFPAVQKIDWEYAVRFNTPEFREMLKAVAFCAGKDESRPTFTGVNFSLAGTTLTLLATNSHRIGRAKMKSFDEAPESRSVIVPAAACESLISSLSGAILTMSISRNRAKFEFEDIEMTVALIDGTFPPVDQIYKTARSRRATLDVAELLAALDRCGVIALQTEYSQVGLEFTPDALTIRAFKAEIGEALEHVDLELTGGALEISFNFKYIWQTLKALSTRKVILELEGELMPALIRGEGADDVDYLITPVRTR